MIELYFIVPADMQAKTMAQWDALRDEIGEAIGGKGPDRWLTIVFWNMPTCSAPAAIFTASGFQRVKALTGPPDHERHDRQ